MYAWEIRRNASMKAQADEDEDEREIAITNVIEVLGLPDDETTRITLGMLVDLGYGQGQAWEYSYPS